MHANEALNARAELNNKEVTSSTCLWEPELCLWVSALKVAQRVGRLMVPTHTRTPRPAAATASYGQKPPTSESRMLQNKNKLNFENAVHRLLAPQREKMVLEQTRFNALPLWPAYH